MGDIGRPIRITQRPAPVERAAAGARAPPAPHQARRRPGVNVEPVEQPLVGFRRWGVRRGGLYSGIFVAGRFVPTPARTMVAPRVKPMPWPPNGAHVAKCWALRGHEAPFGACNCGISAYYELAEEPDLPAPDAVWGAIVAWGRVVECETGFRAQYARPSGCSSLQPAGLRAPAQARARRRRGVRHPAATARRAVAYAGWHGELHQPA